MNRMVRMATALGLAAVTALSVIGCGSVAGGGKQTLTVFNYSEYLDPDVIDQFTQETGIEIKYEEALTPEDMYTKYKAGAISYDLLCTADYMLKRLIEEGEAQPIDISSFENKDNIGQEYWDFSKAFDPENKYTVPHFWGTIGILYDTTKVHGEIDSWDVLFNGEYAGDIIMQNSIRDSFMITLKYLGYSLNTTDEAEIRAAYEALKAQKPDVEAYLVDEARDEVVAGNAAMAVVYSGEAYLGHQYNENLRYTVPKEGSNLWIDSWMVTKNCKNVEAAQKFLDFLCREDIAQKNFEYIYYSTPNEAVIANLSDEERADESLVPNMDAMQNCEVCVVTDEAATELMNELWKELKAN
ncbi:MAG: extracellular solute-binding protein [Lachnospiraceae bacterium]|nr:extracellular solute-binding protein [Lachnospiraceae bacterium]